MNKNTTGHVPLRTCVGCRSVRPKGELLRLVRLPDGSFEIDPAQRKPGRGAYVCLKLECAAQMKKRKALDRSFRQPVPRDFYEEVIAYVRKQLESQD
ncbi:MAG: YlxR family protein [Calditrichaeota bacterium]|nr:YlxR family protein [Calditrichota bacterium]